MAKAADVETATAAETDGGSVVSDTSKLNGSSVNADTSQPAKPPESEKQEKAAVDSAPRSDDEFRDRTGATMQPPQEESSQLKTTAECTFVGAAIGAVAGFILSLF